LQDMDHQETNHGEQRNNLQRIGVEP